MTEAKHLDENIKYVVYKSSKIINTKTGKPLSVSDNGKGYCVVNINRKKQYVHRIVAKYFVPNPNGYKEVNHKDGIKSNNNYQNLEWCDRSMNNLHARRTGLNNGYDMHGKSNPRYKNGLRTIVNKKSICLYCGNDFIAKYPTSTFCNKKCSGRYAVNRMESLKSERQFANYQ